MKRYLKTKKDCHRVSIVSRKPTRLLALTFGLKIGENYWNAIIENMQLFHLSNCEVLDTQRLSEISERFDHNKETMQFP